MRSLLLFISVFSWCSIVTAQQTLELNRNWKFSRAGSEKWYNAEVPGTVHTDLLANKLISDPFYRDNESKVQWVGESGWVYKNVFDVHDELLSRKNIEIIFDGLDTYAQVKLNGSTIISADNMFRQWKAEIKKLLKKKGNILIVHFISAVNVAKAAKMLEAPARPDNERIYARKAQYHFGWDWGPRLVTCGIWKSVRITSIADTEKKSVTQNVQLITQKDSIGESFYFTVNGKPTFIKGANWIPADNFLPRAKKLKRYEQLIKSAKEANINMLRVWGGGVYEDDAFYDLCDKYGIMVWQDFMFAGALYPGDSAFLTNVEEEVRYQVKRLRHHPSIVLWCGNNEIEEAWFNWGWQKQFNYSAEDSMKLWNDYKKIFHELIPNILQELDPQRPYWPSSPSLGWGRDSAYKKGDVHYWGVWWGKEPVEKYNEKVGRFVSEYGMQGMPDIKTIKQFSVPADWDTSSIVMRTHQKHPFGWENIKYYIEQKFRTPKSFDDLVYVSQLMQADAIKTAIEAHRRNKPTTMGTMFWQWNDCWPVTSWSAIDYYGRKKAMYYEVKRGFSDRYILLSYDSVNYYWKLINESKSIDSVDVVVHCITRDGTGMYSFLAGHGAFFIKEDTIMSGWMPRTGLCKEQIGLRASLRRKGKILASSYLFFDAPKDLELGDPQIKYEIKPNSTIEITAKEFAYGVFIDVPDGVELDDNYFHLAPNEKKIVTFKSTISITELKKYIKIKSLVDTY